MADTGLVIDGSHGEAGGQILRTALALAAITRRPIRVERIGAGRPNPGLAAQRLTGLHAVAQICDPDLTGDALGSQEITFAPRSGPRPGSYTFDVAMAREGGSAGSAPLLLRTVVPPLAVADGESAIVV